MLTCQCVRPSQATRTALCEPGCRSVLGAPCLLHANDRSCQTPAPSRFCFRYVLQPLVRIQSEVHFEVINASSLHFLFALFALVLTCADWQPTTQPDTETLCETMSVTLHTNLGDLKIELNCEEVPHATKVRPSLICSFALGSLELT